MFVFGHEVADLQAMRRSKSYRPRDLYDGDPRVRRMVQAFASDLFCPGEPDLFHWVSETILDPHDEYFHLADLPTYLEAHERAAEAFKDPGRWTRMAILNVARIGRFSSDRAVLEYARDIWQLERL